MSGPDVLAGGLTRERGTLAAFSAGDVAARPRRYLRVPADHASPPPRRGDIVGFTPTRCMEGTGLYVLDLGEGPEVAAVSGNHRPGELRIEQRSRPPLILPLAEFERVAVGKVFGIFAAVEDLDRIGAPPLGAIW